MANSTSSLAHGPQTPTRIVLHTTESYGSPQSVVDYWKSQGQGYGAQVIIDQQGNVLRVVPDNQVAYSTGGNNNGTLAIEIVGKAGQSGQQWMANPKQMQAVANQIHMWSSQYDIPLTLSTQHGISTHAMNSRLYPSSEGHSDPGPNFPMTDVMHMAGATGWTQQMTSDALAAPNVPMPYPDASTGSPASTPTTSGLSLTEGQQAFVDRLSADTGLPKQFVTAWVFNEENGSAAQGYQQKNFNNWLNIGMTDSGSYGTNDPMWKDPTKAADETAAWMSGKGGVPGYGHASSGIQDWYKSATSPGATPESIISGLQNSGWASGKYPNLPSLYSQAGGGSFIKPSDTTSPTSPTDSPPTDPQSTAPKTPVDNTRRIISMILGMGGPKMVNVLPNLNFAQPKVDAGIAPTNFAPFLSSSETSNPLLPQPLRLPL